MPIVNGSYYHQCIVIFSSHNINRQSIENMSEQQIKANQTMEVLVTQKEFNNLQSLATREGEPLLHYYRNGGVVVKIGVSFLITFGYLDLIQF